MQVCAHVGAILGQLDFGLLAPRCIVFERFSSLVPSELPAPRHHFLQVYHNGHQSLLAHTQGAAHATIKGRRKAQVVRHHFVVSKTLANTSSRNIRITANAATNSTCARKNPRFHQESAVADPHKHSVLSDVGQLVRPVRARLHLYDCMIAAFRTLEKHDPCT